MSRSSTSVAVVLLLALITPGCSVLAQLQPPAAAAEAKSDAPRAAADPSAAGQAAAAANAFGLDMFAAMRAGKSNANIVFSPASIELALAMARAGARGATADQMDAVMHSFGADALANGVNSLDQLLSSRSGSFRDFGGQQHDLTLTIANAPFAQRDEQWEQAFLDALAERFGAGVRLVDYKSNFEAARRQINSWVNDQTNARIPQLLDQGAVSDFTRLVLVNAIYLKAPWQVPFNDKATKLTDFTLLDGSTVQAQMMSVGGHFAHAQGDGWQAVELPYIGDKLAMTLILPEDFVAYSQALGAEQYGQVTAALAVNEGTVDLPRFDFETKAELADVLAGMGMTDAFDPSLADFTGMTTQEALFISHVIHQANISVDEKGTEAAAATAVAMDASAAPTGPFHITFDRPFIFAVRDLDTGAVLFLGQVTDPTDQ